MSHSTSLRNCCSISLIVYQSLIVAQAVQYMSWCILGLPRVRLLATMPLQSTVAEVECYVIHDGIPLPKTTFHSEMLRLQSEDGGDYRGWLERYGAEFADYITKNYGRKCWHCEKQIILDYCKIDPVLEKPETEEEKKYMHRECWDRLKLAAQNKRRRLRYAAKKNAQAALPAAAAEPVGGLGYEPQPMLASEGPPPPVLALGSLPPLSALPAPEPAAPPSPPSTEPDPEPADAAAGGACKSSSKASEKRL